jgi:hypothetical protein
MPCCRFILGLAVGWFCWASSASAILIETAGVRVGGYLVRSDDKKLTIRIDTKAGQETVKEYVRANIKIIHQVDVKRLEGLSKENPKGYYDYAEELARQEADPEAKYMARRLYLIAASLDPQKHGTRSLLRMGDLAGTPAEARKCRALAFLLDAKADARLLATDDAKPVEPRKDQVDGLHDFTKSMQYYRAGKVKLALETANRKGMDKVFSMAPGDLDQRAFIRMCADVNCATCKTKGKVRCPNCAGKGIVRGMFGANEYCTMCSGKKMSTCNACEGRGVNQDLSDDTLRVILRAELWATEQLLGGEAAVDKGVKSDKKKWSSVLQRRQLSPVSPLSLETITELNPRKCHYRNGNWVVPSD